MTPNSSRNLRIYNQSILLFNKIWIWDHKLILPLKCHSNKSGTPTNTWLWQALWMIIDAWPLTILSSSHSSLQLLHQTCKDITLKVTSRCRLRLLLRVLWKSSKMSLRLVWRNMSNGTINQSTNTSHIKAHLKSKWELCHQEWRKEMTFFNSQKHISPKLI